MQSELLMTPIIQHGFVGITAVLLAIQVWLIRRLLTVLEDNNTVIAENTEAIRSLDNRSVESLRLCGDIRDRLLTRPCISHFDGSTLCQKSG